MICKEEYTYRVTTKSKWNIKVCVIFKYNLHTIHITNHKYNKGNYSSCYFCNCHCCYTTKYENKMENHRLCTKKSQCNKITDWCPGELLWLLADMCVKPLDDVNEGIGFSINLVKWVGITSVFQHPEIDKQCHISTISMITYYIVQAQVKFTSAEQQMNATVKSVWKEPFWIDNLSGKGQIWIDHFCMTSRMVVSDGFHCTEYLNTTMSKKIASTSLNKLSVANQLSK